MKKEYNLEGIKCAGCANTVKERFSNVPGVTNVEVSLENKVATVEGDASVDALQASLEGNTASKNNQPQKGRAIFARPFFYLLPFSPQSLVRRSNIVKRF